MIPRVLIVAPSLRILGGQAVQASALLQRLRGEGVAIDFLEVNPQLPGLLGRLQRVKYVRTVLTETAYIASLLLRVPRYDVLHIFSASYWSFLLAPGPAILIGRLFGKATLLNYRSGEAEDHLANWKTAVPLLRQATRIVVPSGYLVDVFARFGLKATSIFNIVDTSRFRFRLRKTPRPVFLSNRNLQPLYNVGCIIDAFRQIQAALPEARLIVAGDGREREQLEERVREFGLRNVEFLGRVEHGRMHELYEEADVYLNSPNIDNMPVSIIEAYACGLPVVTTDAGGIPYIVTHDRTGLIVRRGDSGDMAAQVLRLFHEEGLAERLTSNAASECARYQWPAVREHWLALYRELASGSTRQRGAPASENSAAT